MSTALPPAPQDPLPAGFAVRIDAQTQRRDDGATLLGGSPFRMLRLAPRARALITGDRLVVDGATSAALAARLLDAGVAHPDLTPGSGPYEVTVVVPVRDRPQELARLLAGLRGDPATRALPVVVVDDGSVDAGALDAAAERFAARVLRHETSRGPAAARNTGLRTATTALVAFLDSDCVPQPGWLDRLMPHLTDPRLAVVAPRIVPLPGGPAGWLPDYDAVAGALDMGAQAAPVRPWSTVSYVPSAALVARRAALGDGFDDTMRVAEDVDLVWRLHAAGWRVRYEPAAEVAHQHPTHTSEWVRRRTFYGTGAALLAARHGSAVAPLVIDPSTALAWLLATAGGRTGKAAAAGVLAITVGRLARRLARPGEPVPVRLSTALVLRGTGASGRALARAATRHHWPLAVAAAALSRPARRCLLAVAVGDAVLGWWPVRGRMRLAPFAAARRLDDLAYGSGLWAGVLRARSPRALLPAAPARIEARASLVDRLPTTYFWCNRPRARTMGSP